MTMTIHIRTVPYKFFRLYFLFLLSIYFELEQVIFMIVIPLHVKKLYFFYIIVLFCHHDLLRATYVDVSTTGATARMARTHAGI
jgi:hypothetical protein